MTKRAFSISAPLFASLAALSLVWMTACHLTADDTDAGADAAGEASTADGGTDSGASSLSCYVATQFTCNEYPNPTPGQTTDVPVACSSASGELKEPAACPMAGFMGKCTRPDGPTIPGPYVERFYAGADIAYAQDFCVNTASGVWSTTF